jgi:Fe-S-cluster containining protein
MTISDGVNAEDGRDADRLASVEAARRSKAVHDAIRRRRDPLAESRLLHMAMRANSSTQRIQWFRRAAEAAQRSASEVSPCGKGCAACCHVGVLVAEREARAIARQLGRELAEPRSTAVINVQGGSDAIDEALAAVKKLAQEFEGKPCLFLEADECGIYDSRPLACRLHVSVATTAASCVISPGNPRDVPYLDVRLHQVAYLLAQGPNSRYADLRDWFGAPS